MTDEENPKAHIHTQEHSYTVRETKYCSYDSKCHKSDEEGQHCVMV